MSRSYVSPDYTLVLVGVLQEDKGDYQCVAYNNITMETRVSLKGELYVTGQEGMKSFPPPPQLFVISSIFPSLAFP